MNKNATINRISILSSLPRSTLFLFATACISLGACKIYKNPNYLIYDQSPRDQAFKHYDPPIKIGDQLSISVSALDPESAIPYNVPDGKFLQIDSAGKISYPLLGPVQAEGLTRNALRDALLIRLRLYLTDPTVTVDFANFKITVLGEVNKQGSFPVPDGKINIIEAIALAGDLTRFGERYPVTIIRENKKGREIGKIDLQSNTIFSSPYYHLQQNDIVYVSSIPEKQTVKQEVRSRRFTTILGIVGIATSITFIVLSITDDN